MLSSVLRAVEYVDFYHNVLYRICLYKTGYGFRSWSRRAPVRSLVMISYIIIFVWEIGAFSRPPESAVRGEFRSRRRRASSRPTGSDDARRHPTTMTTNAPRWPVVLVSGADGSAGNRSPRALCTPRRPAKMASRRAQPGRRGPRLSYWTGVWGGHECASAATAATKGSPPRRVPPSIIGRATLQPSARNFVWVFFFVFFQFFLRLSRYSPARSSARPNALSKRYVSIVKIWRKTLTTTIWFLYK